MSDLIVTSNQVDRAGDKITLEQFLALAQSDEGIDVKGNLYFDVIGLPVDIYTAIKQQTPLQLFTSNGQIPPEYSGLTVENWGFAPEPVNNFGTQAQDNTTQSFNPIPDNSVAQPQDAPQQEFDDFGMERNSDKEVGNPIKNFFGKKNKDVVDEQPENEEPANKPIDDLEAAKIASLFQDSTSINEQESEYDNKEATVFLFGSSKGGTGKTFTCMISAYRYATVHPNKKIAVCDFDIIDGQIAITIHKVQPTMYQFYQKWRLGERDFRTMEDFKVNSPKFPVNLDFYLAPKDIYIKDVTFWEDIIANLISNYDAVFFDSGIDYMHIEPISDVYKLADKIILISTTSIKSVSSVSKQVKRLTGEIENDVFSPEDGLKDKINLVITQTSKKDQMNDIVFNTLDKLGPIIGVFGVITSQIQEAEYFGRWDIFDKNDKFNAILDTICEL